jgi:rod shape-determining protein MreD
MRYWTGAVIALFLALLQASSIEQFKVLGVTPNLLLVLLVSWLVVRGLDDVLPMIAVAGITMGFVGLQTPGLVLLALLPIAGLGVARELHVIHSDLLLVLALVLVATVAYESIIVATLVASGGGYDLAAALRSAIVPSALVNVLLTPPVYVVMRLAKPALRRNRLTY